MNCEVLNVSRKITVVMGVIGADVHAVGNRILQYAFEQEEIKVVNLGVMVTQDEFIKAALETDSDAIIMSSLYGHGEIDCRGLREKCEEAGLENILLYIGGNLVVGKTPFSEIEQKFKKMGFNRVYPPGTPPETGIKDLKKDLGVG